MTWTSSEPEESQPIWKIGSGRREIRTRFSIEHPPRSINHRSRRKIPSRESDTPRRHGLLLLEFPPPFAFMYQQPLTIVTWSRGVNDDIPAIRHCSGDS